jgi:hypothetical protein
MGDTTLYCPNKAFLQPQTLFLPQMFYQRSLHILLNCADKTERNRFLNTTHMMKHNDGGNANNYIGHKDISEAQIEINQSINLCYVIIWNLRKEILISSSHSSASSSSSSSSSSEYHAMIVTYIIS